MKYIKLFENFDEYNYDNAKNNPDKIVIKFNDAGYDQFWNQYIKQTDTSYNPHSTWVYFDSWSDLERPGGTHHDAKGLEMTDGEYYLLFKTYDKKEVDDWYKGGRREGMLSATFFFLKYGKEAGEIGIYSVYGKEYQDIQANKEYHDTKLKGDYQMLTYCRFDKVDMSRLVEPGSVDHRGYFKVIDVK